MQACPPSAGRQRRPEDIKREIVLSVRARYPILWLLSWEEGRVRRLLREVAGEMEKKIFFWRSSKGFDGEDPRLKALKKPISAIEFVATSPERAIFVFEDFHPFLDDHQIVRALRDAAESLRKSFKTLVLVSADLKIPTELQKDITVFDIPLPDQDELSRLLSSFLASLSTRKDLKLDLSSDLFERIVKASLGLTENEAENVFAKALVRDRRFTEADLPLIIAEKRQIIRKTGLLEYYDLTESMEGVGGLDNLKKWLLRRREAFSERARDYGLPQPKGLLLLGVQGCGKSLSAKAIASLWKLPLLRLDVGNVFASYIGASEANMRRAIKIAESLSPTVLWLDEIEKAFAGTLGSGVSDAGTTQRVFATFLTWLQEKTKPVFVIATANRIKALPPELMRKGRFDEIFFIDLPADAERREIFQIHLRRRGRKPEAYDLNKLAQKSVGFSGAEIEEAVISAMYAAFPENRDFTTRDILEVLGETVPLATTAREETTALRQWAHDRARPASSLETPSSEP